METHALRRSRSQQPDAHALAGFHLQRLIHILGGVPIEHGERGGARRNAVRGNFGKFITVSRSLSRIGQVCFILNHHILMVYRFQIRRVDNDGTVHARRHMQAHGRGRAVVQPNTRAGSLKTVGQLLARGNGFHRVIGRNHARVEVERMPHRTVVLQGNLEDVAQLTVQHRAHIRTVECPCLYIKPGCNFTVELLHIHGHLVHGLTVTFLARRHGTQHRITALIVLAGRCVHINIRVLRGQQVRICARAI